MLWAQDRGNAISPDDTEPLEGPRHRAHCAPMALIAFCRDCLAETRAGATRCHVCGSPRIARNDEFADLSIAHIDCDAFYAAVEKRDDPRLADLPVIIGGGKRGVVSTCCYVARIHGVRSAMPMFKALKLCPEAVVITPDMVKYVRVRREGMIRPGDALRLVARPNPGWTIARAFVVKQTPWDVEGARALAALPGLGSDWRAKMLARASANPA